MSDGNDYKITTSDNTGTITVTSSPYIINNSVYMVPNNVVWTGATISYYHSDNGIVWYTLPEDPISRLKRFLKENNYKE